MQNSVIVIQKFLKKKKPHARSTNKAYSKASTFKKYITKTEDTRKKIKLQCACLTAVNKNKHYRACPKMAA